MLDACAVVLVPQSSFHAGTAFLAFAPVTSVFYHWVMGTMFMSVYLLQALYLC